MIEEGEDELEEMVDIRGQKEEPGGPEIMTERVLRLCDISNQKNLSKMMPGQKLDTAANELTDAEQQQPISIEK